MADNQQEPTIIGIERPSRSGRAWAIKFREIVSHPAVAAALGSFAAFIATQGAEYLKANRAESSELMLDELQDGRDLAASLEEPKTSQEAAAVISKLKIQLGVFQTAQARTMMQNTIALYDNQRSALGDAEQQARSAKEVADRAAKEAEAQQQNELLRLQAEQAAKTAAEAEKKRQDQIKVMKQIQVESLRGIGGGGFFRF
ncbi:hypothetical protein ELH93_22245 [Rhizobium leguminosarum]|uniref:Uncharacterized protein n=1 Tax=Rhizobium leguminosarum TaxID=384 RepID=A0ABD7PXY3_RHILE|nr:hypothetical protein [Rhizobium leguminosarum]TAW32061.1 hypothetical protein ELI19_22245 [Rhizobium leguminosarum]TAW45792.1 hypothetical protein ELI18_22215 [Rhizobium leguminosarum]TAY35172.1 hypothetical protein ELH93_22245 [Rhizobium leguminosarum]